MIPEQLFTPSKVHDPPPARDPPPVPPFFMELRRKIKKLKLRTEFSSRRLRKPDPNSTSASVMLADHFRALRQVDLFKVDFAVKVGGASEEQIDQ